MSSRALIASSERSGIQIINAASGILMAAKIKSKAHSGISFSMLLPVTARTEPHFAASEKPCLAASGPRGKGRAGHMRKAEAAA